MVFQLAIGIAQELDMQTASYVEPILHYRVNISKNVHFFVVNVEVPIMVFCYEAQTY